MTLSFTASELIQTPVVMLLGIAGMVAYVGGNNWTATAIVGKAEGVAAFFIAAVDLIGNIANAVTATSPAGAEVAFSASPTDNLDPSPGVTATPASGSVFPLGITTVNASATDAAGNSAIGNFTISVGNLVDGVSPISPMEARSQSGMDQVAFTVTVSSAARVAGPAGTTTFMMQFNPAASGAKSAAIHIASDDADENPFDIILSGRVLSAGDDTDLDGLTMPRNS